MCGRSVVLRSRVQLDRAIRELAQEVVWVTGDRNPSEGRRAHRDRADG